ncbi:hypothetical protein AU476_28815 [Cupriavidus sp. UYMSc13B]|nr:hypothetical protein AU476_28815 [Cupriavidus sp. UYMSc13B]
MEHSQPLDKSPARTAQPPTADLLSRLQQIVGSQHVLTGDTSTYRYRKGIRFGLGDAVAVVSPASLVEQWKVVKACVEANKIVIMQVGRTTKLARWKESQEAQQADA